MFLDHLRSSYKLRSYYERSSSMPYVGLDGWMGWDWMIIIGHRYSKSTLDANKCGHSKSYWLVGQSKHGLECNRWSNCIGWYFVKKKTKPTPPKLKWLGCLCGTWNWHSMTSNLPRGALLFFLIHFAFDLHCSSKGCLRAGGPLWLRPRIKSFGPFHPSFIAKT